MSVTSTPINRLTRSARKVEKPRPLKLGQNTTTHNRHSLSEVRLSTVEEIMNLTDTVVSHLANGNYDKTIQPHIKNLHDVLKVYGSKLESIYKDQLDRAFVVFRNSCRDEELDYLSRVLLLEIIELRATQWSHQDFANSYYKSKLTHVDLDTVTTPTLDNTFTPTSLFAPVVIGGMGMPQPQPLLLGPGELVKSSGKYPSPTKVLGKNYCKDEVVIRNSDSGKVMGIKGRRVHMIEELSETVISFQRVNPGAKERLVQITGPTEEKILYAKQLMEETIRRNASPIRAEADGERLGSTSSLNSSISDESPLPAGKRTNLLHSLSTNDATLGEYKYTVTVNDESIKITGTNLDLVRIAKLVLDEYFSPGGDEYGDEIFEHIERPQLAADDIQETANDDLSKNIQNAAKVKDGNSGIDEGALDQATNGLLKYTAEEIVRFVDSPLSKETPTDWLKIVRDCPAIARKAPIDWLESAIILQRRAFEGCALITAHVPSSPVPSTDVDSQIV